LRYGDAGGSALEFVNVDIKSTGTGALRTQRWTATGTAPASTARVTGGLYITVADGETVNFTVRIGLPQIELGPSASSPIKTSSGAVTRALDSLWLPVAPWFNETEGTMLVEWRAGVLTDNNAWAAIHNNSNDNEIHRWLNVASSFSNYLGRTGNVTNPTHSSGAQSVNSVRRAVTRWAANNYATSFDGAAVLTTSVAGTPSGLTRLQVGNIRAGTIPAFGHIRRIVALPAGLTNAQIQALSGATL
jgi:hypothetical protein